MSHLTSPNQLLSDGIEMELGGQPPVTEQDEHKLVRFFAANIVPEVAESACVLLTRMYPAHFTHLSKDEDKVRLLVVLQLAAEAEAK